MSKESGIPTFREAQDGLWARYDPAELATPEAFRSNPERVWGWYRHRRDLVRWAAPHRGHEALVALEVRFPDLVIVTQNIDGLHQRAGSARVIELHGNVLRYKCFDRQHPVDLDGGWDGGAQPAHAGPADGPAPPPSCPLCGSPARPDVVWFGEPLPAAALREADHLARSSDLMLVVGTSGVVYPAAALPAIAATSGAHLVEINTEPSQLTGLMHEFIEGTAEATLPALVERLGDTPT